MAGAEAKQKAGFRKLGTVGTQTATVQGRQGRPPMPESGLGRAFYGLINTYTGQGGQKGEPEDYLAKERPKSGLGNFLYGFAQGYTKQGGQGATALGNGAASSAPLTKAEQEDADAAKERRRRASAGGSGYTARVLGG